MPHTTTPSEVATDRRATVLDSALETFARFGFRKTTMDEVARAACISRPGLYFLFDSKESLFRAAATRALEIDLAAAERVLTSGRGSLQSRLVGAFDHWAGRYIGPGARDIAGVVEANPTLLGDVVTTAPLRFEQIVIVALERTGLSTSAARRAARTLISVSVGLKHQVDDRDSYTSRFRHAVDLVVRDA